jgi:hypothetical protein
VIDESDEEWRGGEEASEGWERQRGREGSRVASRPLACTSLIWGKALNTLPYISHNCHINVLTCS